MSKYDNLKHVDDMGKSYKLIPYKFDMVTARLFCAVVGVAGGVKVICPEGEEEKDALRDWWINKTRIAQTPK